MAKINDNYDYFAEYLDTLISGSELREMRKNFRTDDLFSQDPTKILAELEKFWIKKWNENLDVSTGKDRDVQMKLAQQRSKNFKSFVQNVLNKRTKLDFKNPYKTGEKVNFEKFYETYKSLTGEKDITGITKRTEKISKKLTGEAPITTKKSIFINQIRTSIDNAIEGGNSETLLLYRDIVRDMSKVKQNKRPLTEYQRFSLLRELDNAMGKFTPEESLLGGKSDDELKIALELKGLNTKQLIDRQDILKAVNSFNKGKNKWDKIGLRKYDKNEQELISEITSLRGGYEDSSLVGKSEKFLRDLRNKIRKNIRPDKKSIYLRRDGLPEKIGEVRDLYLKEGKSISNKEISDIRKEVSKELFFLDEKEQEEIANKRLAEKAISIPTIEKEIEQRFAKQKYNDPNRKLDYADYRELFSYGSKKFKKNLSLNPEKYIDSISGKEKINLNRINVSDWSFYKEELKKEINTQEKKLYINLANELPKPEEFKAVTDDELKKFKVLKKKNLIDDIIKRRESERERIRFLKESEEKFKQKNQR